MKIKIISAFIIVLFILNTITIASTEVYITSSGKKYHTSGCQYLSKSKIAIDLEDAIEKGYSPCSKCGAGSISVSKESKETKKDTKSTKFTLSDEEKEKANKLLEEMEEDNETNSENNNHENSITKTETDKLNKTIEEKEEIISNLFDRTAELENTIEELKSKQESSSENSFIGTTILIIIGCFASYKVGTNKNKKRRNK